MAVKRGYLSDFLLKLFCFSDRIAGIKEFRGVSAPADILCIPIAMDMDFSLGPSD